ncbi:MAG: leucyl aminopeptidase family protein [Rhodobacteraceae bacterium]|nr:leucyl aminopeptidase family protein [Paracoccaceae bacterium]
MLLAKPEICAKTDIAPGRPRIAFLLPDGEDGGADARFSLAETAYHDAGLSLDQVDHPILVVPTGPNPGPYVLIRIDEDRGKIRSRAGSALRALQAHRVQACTVLLPDADTATIQAIVEGILSANHVFTSDGPARGRMHVITDLNFAFDKPGEESARAVNRAWLTSLASLNARDLATEPANTLTPEVFKQRCVELAGDTGMDITVMERPDLEAAGMQGILTVSAGSAHDAYLIELAWRPGGLVGEAEAAPVVLVGKTVTFDSGGISLKNALDMDHMKADMGGGAAVFGLMQMVAALAPEFPVTAVFAVVENMPGPNAMRPSDVIRTASGKTVEIINTDAEGRLILADALHHAAGMNPRVVIDFATLTGASAGIFGPIGIGTFSNDDAWFKRLQDADAFACERVWRLPLWEQYLEFLKSPVADLRNFSLIGHNGSTLTAAAFLMQFVGDHPWMHLDLYNTCWNASATDSLMPVGPTGSGARVVAQMLINMTEHNHRNTTSKNRNTV